MATSFGSHVSVQAKQILEEAIRIVEETMPPHKGDPVIVGAMIQAMATLIASKQ